MSPVDRALDAVGRRARLARAEAADRWSRATGLASDELPTWSDRLLAAGRLTVNFHPDRVARSGRSVAAGLLDEGRYRSQWVTGISNGGRSAVIGGERAGWEDPVADIDRWLDAGEPGVETGSSSTTVRG